MNVVFEWAVSSVLGSPNAQAGAIDVIAIRKQDESLSCSPFHVKLGKSSKKGEKGIVKVKVNKQDVELSMKLGPAGEAFFVERSRDFRRDPSGSFPTSPRDFQDNQPFLSPRNAEDNISVPLNAGDAVSAKDDPITSTSTADLISDVDLEVQVPAPISPQLSLKRSPGSSSEFTRPRSFSESAVVLSQSQTVPSVSLEGDCDKMELVTQHAQSSPQGEGDDHHHGISMDHNHEKIMLTGSGSSSSSAPLVPLLQLPSAEAAGTGSEQDAQVGIAEEVPVEGAEVEPAVMIPAAEESTVSWIWRWGTLPKKTKPKSASDLESLPANAAATAAATTVPPSTGDAPEVDEVPTVEARSTGTAAVAKGRGLNVRHRAVSLPVLRQYESSRIGRNKQTQARQQRAEAKADPSAPTMAVFTQLVTAIESDIAPGSPLKNAAAFGLDKEDVGEFSSLLAAARVDNSRFHALSLCGQYLSATDSDMESGGKVPQNAAELRQLLETHLITPHDIVQSESPVPASAEEQEGNYKNSNNTINPDTTPEGARDDTRRNICPSILASPHLVVILDDFMLPMRAAEKLLQKVCATDGDASVPLTTQDVASAGAFPINDQQVQDVLAELEKDLDLDPDLQSESAGPRPSEVTRLPEWAGKRISRWGREFESIERKDSALNDAFTAASVTPDQAISAAALGGSAVMLTSVEESTSMEDRDRIGSTPLGHMSWQQSFSDLVQAYRVHNIHTIHSYLDLNARAHRFGDTYNEISDGDVASYTEKWNRLQSSSSSPGPSATSGSFTALLALDTHTIHRLYTSEQDLDKWAVGVGLGLCGGTHTHSACTSRVQSQDPYEEDHFASRGLSLSQHGNDQSQQDTSQADSKHLPTHHRQHQEDHQEQKQEHSHLNESADYGVGEGYSFMSHSDGDGGAGADVGGLLSALGSHNSLPALQEIEVGDVDGEDEMNETNETNEADEVVEKSDALQDMGGDSDDQDIGGDAAASVNAVETNKYQPSPQSDKVPPPRVPSYIQQQSQQQPLEDTNSTTDGADTDNDCLSLQDIDFEDISPEPATGDFYESDTDSYLSLSLEEGESGRHHNNNTSRRSSMRSNHAAANMGEADEENAAKNNTLSSNNNNNNTSAQEIQIGRRRIRRYLYRKVLVPSAEQLSSLPLQDGVNEVEFELPGCTPLRSCLYVWPSDCRIIVTDIEGVFTHATAHNPMNSTTVWMQFLGGGGALNSRNVTSKKNHFDEAIRLFRALHHQGYRILYVAQNSTNTTTAGGNSNALLSSQEYLQGIRTSTGESLPPGPIFKSPDSLIRAFGASRTDVFKAGALKGVKSLFPSSHNPYHACFCIRESDSIPFARFGFPEGRIFLVSEKGEVKSANRTCNFTFPRLTELLHQIFPHVVDSQSSGPSSSTKGGSVKLTEGVQQANTSTGATTGSSNNSSSSSGDRRPTLEVDTTIAASTATASTITSAVADLISPRQQAVVTPFSPTSSTINPPHQQPHHLSGTFTAPTAVFSPTSAGVGPVTPSSALNSVKSPKSIPFSSLTCGTEDTYNDYNFWKIPPQAIEEDDFY